jgi:hypothetical protein
MGEMLTKQFWLYGWGQRMGRLAPKGQAPAWSLVLLGLAIEADEPSQLVQVDVATLGWRASLAHEAVEAALQRFRELGVLTPLGDLERVDPTRVEGCPLSRQKERYFERQRQQFRQRSQDENA